MPPETKRWPNVVLREKRHEYGHIHTFIFDKPSDFEFGPGYYVHMRIHSVPAPHKAVRDLSIAAAPSDPHLMFTTTVESGSPFKTEILKLEPGDSIELFKIKTYLEVPRDGELIMIAGGIGITPFRSIIREHAAGSLGFKPTLVHIARENYLYKNELDYFPIEQLHITREETEDTLHILQEQKPNAIFMVAGPPSFVDAIVVSLKEKGIPEERIQTDSFDGLQ